MRAPIGLGEQIARGFLVGRRAAGHRQAIGRDRDVTGERRAPRHVFDVLVEAAVFVDDEDAGQLVVFA